MRERATLPLADLAHVALLWPGAKALVVSDLHLEKGAAFAPWHLPPPTTPRNLDRHHWSHNPAEVVISLGDFHDLQVIDRSARTCWRGSSADRLAAGHGNHAPIFGALRRGAARILHHRHEAACSPRLENLGHWHPKVSIASGAKRVITRACFIDERRLILPFGTTGGSTFGIRRL